MISEKGFDSFDVRKTFEEIFGEGKVSYIYPKNLFEENLSDAIFYVFHGEFISEVRRNPMQYEVQTYPLDIVELKYLRPGHIEYSAVKLELHMNHGLMFTFDSGEDNHESWRKSFTAIIQEIYCHLIT